MPSALAILENASAVFTVPTAGVVTDPATGNVSPATTTITVGLYLRQGGITEADLQGVQVDAESFEGYAIDPQVLDARITAGTQGILTFSSDAPASCSVLQARYPYGTTGILGATLQDALGDRIRIVRFRQS